MRFAVPFILFACFASFGAVASDLDTALRQSYVSCVGISDMLNDVKKLAGVNTAVTGVGTVAGGGAVIAGVAKKNLMNKLRKIEDESETDNIAYNDIAITWRTDFKPNSKSKAKKLGNWRTGLLAVNTATNVAGAVIAGKNAHNEDLENRIKECSQVIDELKDAIVRAKYEDIDTSEANAIYDACSGYKYVDLSVLTKRAKGAEISSIIGGSAGAVGVITSAVANKSSGEKERKLDTASNVLAGGATVLTGTATVFNATQIAAAKKIISIAEQCEGLLK